MSRRTRVLQTLIVAAIAAVTLAGLRPATACNDPKKAVALESPGVPLDTAGDDLAWVYVTENLQRAGSGNASDWREALTHVSLAERKSGLWFRLGDARYVSHDAELISSLDEMFTPGRDLGHEVSLLGQIVRHLGSEQAAVGREQGRLGQKQGQLARRQAVLISRIECSADDATAQQLKAEIDELATEQEALGQLMHDLGDRQERLANRMDRLIAMQENLAERQQELAAGTREALEQILRESVVEGLSIRVSGGA